MATLVDFAALSLLPILWWREVASRLRAGQCPSEILDQLIGERPPNPAISSPVLRGRAAAAIASRHRCLDPICWTDPDYPPALAAIIDPPPMLWLTGQRRALLGPAVAIVGSRAGSPYAISVAERLATDLAARGVTVISGLARGVDSAAHRGALAAPGVTVAVLGSGVDVVYPPEHRALATAISARGALISELLPGTPPLKPFFPRRNRIISGLSRAVVVIEAGEKSGSLITARCALEQGREVLAVPGNVLNGRNRGGHALLRDGAKIVETADDILEELGYAVRNPSRGEAASKSVSPGASDPVLGCFLPGESCDLDAIAERTGLTPARLLPRLFELELEGRVRRTGGGRFLLI